MSISRRTLTDDDLVAVLRSRAGESQRAGELVEHIVATVAMRPRSRGWRIELPPLARPIAILLAAGLLAGGLGFAALQGGRDDGVTGPNEVAYVVADYAWDGATDAHGAPMPIAEDRRIFRIAAAGGPAVLVDRISLGPETLLGRDSVGPMVRWSPDGSGLAYRLLVGRPGIYIVHSDGTGTVRLTDASEPGWQAEWGSATGGFDWSPDGTRIAFAAPAAGGASFGASPVSSLYVVDVRTGATVELAGTNGRGGVVGPVAWSPDGNRLAFARTKGTLRDAVHGLFVVDADGANERRLAEIDHADLFGFGWSPDGKRLAFSRSDGVAAITGTSYQRDGSGGEGLWVIDVNGTGIRKINRGDWIAPTEVIDVMGQLVLWSPDGRWVATFGPAGAITLFAVNGSTERVLPGTTSSFDWSPDGSAVVYFEGGHRDPALPATWVAPSIWVVNADGTGRRWLADGEYPDWSR